MYFLGVEITILMLVALISAQQINSGTGAQPTVTPVANPPSSTLPPSTFPTTVFTPFNKTTEVAIPTSATPYISNTSDATSTTSTTTTTTTTTKPSVYSGSILLSSVSPTIINNSDVKNWLNVMTKQDFDVTIVEQKIKSSVVTSVKQKKRRRRRKRQVGTNGTQPTTTTVNKTQIIYIASTNNSINVSNYFQNNNNNNNPIAGQQVESALLWPAVEGGQCNASVCSPAEKCMLNDNNTLNCVGCATLGNNPNNNNNDAYRSFFFCSAATITTTPKPLDNRNLLGLIAIPCVIALILIIVLVVCLIQRRSKRKKNQDIHKIHPAVYEATDAGVLDRVNFENNENGGTVRSEVYKSRGDFNSVRSGRNGYENDNDDGLY